MENPWIKYSFLERKFPLFLHSSSPLCLYILSSVSQQIFHIVQAKMLIKYSLKCLLIIYNSILIPTLLMTPPSRGDETATNLFCDKIAADLSIVACSVNLPACHLPSMLCFSTWRSSSHPLWTSLICLSKLCNCSCFFSIQSTKWTMKMHSQVRSR